VSLRAGTAASSQPFDLTGCSVHAQIRETWNGPLLKEIAVTVTDAPGGLFDLVIDDRARTLRRFTINWVRARCQLIRSSSSSPSPARK
jgi:hypothetical protein